MLDESPWLKVALAVLDMYVENYLFGYGKVTLCLLNMQPLGIPGRVLVGEGVLTKMCRKKPKARQFFLFNDTLVYGNIVISKKKVNYLSPSKLKNLVMIRCCCYFQYNKQHIIPLEEIKLQPLEDDGRKFIRNVE